jgi:hypothetical protein
MITKEKPNFYEYSLEPDWAEIERLPELLRSSLSQIVLSEDDFHSLLMISTELVENAIKYGKYSTEDQIRFGIRIHKKRISLEVKNLVHQESIENLKRLDEKIQWIRGFQNPFEAYVERLKEISSLELSRGESGLGLVRIAYEGQASLDFFLDENDVLMVVAEYIYK